MIIAIPIMQSVSGTLAQFIVIIIIHIIFWKDGQIVQN